VLAAAAALAACSDDTAPARALGATEPLLEAFLPPGGTVNTAQPERLEVCKVYVMTSGATPPASTTFSFSSVAHPEANQNFTITSAAAGSLACREIWLDGGPGGNVTVTEPAIAGFTTKVSRTENIGGTISGPFVTDPGNSATGLVSGSGGANGQSTGQLIVFTNTEQVTPPPPPPPPPSGCTLTQGYWKTHSIHGPASKPDATWDDPAIGGPDADFYHSGLSWYELFWTEPKGGNAYIQLAHQYMAAKLNIAAGATPTAEVTAAITAAEAFFNDAANTPSTDLTKAEQDALRDYASTLGQFNEGTIGPGHCDDED
jgi:hypothetical protein